MIEKGPEGAETRPEEVAAYIAVLTTEMVRLARSHKLGTLAYLLELARLEAMEQSDGAASGGAKRFAS